MYWYLERLLKRGRLVLRILSYGGVRSVALAMPDLVAELINVLVWSLLSLGSDLHHVVGVCFHECLSREQTEVCKHKQHFTAQANSSTTISYNKLLKIQPLNAPTKAAAVGETSTRTIHLKIVFQGICYNLLKYVSIHESIQRVQWWCFLQKLLLQAIYCSNASHIHVLWLMLVKWQGNNYGQSLLYIVLSSSFIQCWCTISIVTQSIETVRKKAKTQPF